MIFLRLISAVAFLALVALISLGLPDVISLLKNRQNLIASLFVICSFLFIPMGSLPTYLSFSGSALIFILFLFIAQILFDKNRKLLTISALVYIVFAILLYYCREIGFAGDAYTLDLLSAVSVWQGADLTGKLLAAVSALLFICLAYCFSKGRNKESFVKIYTTAICAAVICFALPLHFGLDYGFTGLRLYLTDFICFWFAVIMLRTMILGINEANR